MSQSNRSSHSTSSLPFLNPTKIQSLKSFMASDELITIVPNFTYKSKMDFLVTVSATIGPFQAGIESVVPLWIGIYLKRRNLCRIRCPQWMTVSYLRETLKIEKNDPAIFGQRLPFYYAEISHEIFKVIGAERSAVHAASGMEEEVMDSEVVKVLLEDIQAIRMSKVRNSVHLISKNLEGNDINSINLPLVTVGIDGMGSVEISAIKPILETAIGDHFKLTRAGSSGRR